LLLLWLWLYCVSECPPHIFESGRAASSRTEDLTASLIDAETKFAKEEAMVRCCICFCSTPHGFKATFLASWVRTAEIMSSFCIDSFPIRESSSISIDGCCQEWLYTLESSVCISRTLSVVYKIESYAVCSALGVGWLRQSHWLVDVRGFFRFVAVQLSALHKRSYSKQSPWPK